MGLTVGQFAPCGSFNVPRKTAAGGTAFYKIIPPLGGAAGSAESIILPGNSANTLGQTNPNLGQYITHVTKACYTTGATAHLIQILRPLNYTWVTAAVAKNATTMALYDDPGIWSTNYKYALPAGAVVGAVADNGIGAATTPSIITQLEDGTWFLSLVTSYSAPTLTLTTATPNVTGGGILKGAPVYYYIPGATQLDPGTGDIQPTKNIAASATDDVTWSETIFGIVAALNPGDPLLFYSPNTTNAGILEYLTGYYTKL